MEQYNINKQCTVPHCNSLLEDTIKQYCKGMAMNEPLMISYTDLSSGFRNLSKNGSENPKVTDLNWLNPAPTKDLRWK